MASGIPVSRALRRERWRLVARIIHASEVPLFLLSAVWLVLLVLEMTRGLGPILSRLNIAIWALFVVQFAAEVLIAPNRVVYLKRQWLTLIALLLPPLRLLRIARVARLIRGARAMRGLRLLRVITAANRGVGALARTMRRRGAGYVAAVTAVVLAAGAAGLLAFERDVPGSPLTAYGPALWWTAMLLTTMGTDYWPQTAEGRLLCLALSIYAFAAFGYLTAALASFFVGRDQQDAESRESLAARLERIEVLLRER